MSILVEADMDRIGNVVVTPVSSRVRRRYEKYMKEMTGRADASAFFQEGDAASDFLEDFPAQHRRSLESGWSVRFKVDPWVFGHWLGWDAHNV